ncbi:MAG TPA: hypothetical protein VMU37_04865 [Caulobacteraceae bacterium]|nr:hypothetical protein [Caulobacteraceae bacterium]
MILTVAILAIAAAAGRAAQTLDVNGFPLGSYTLDAAGRCIGPSPKTKVAPQSRCAMIEPAPVRPHSTERVRCGKTSATTGKICPAR